VVFENGEVEPPFKEGETGRKMGNGQERVSEKSEMGGGVDHHMRVESQEKYIRRGEKN